MSYICLNCKATDESVDKPSRCLRCCVWGRMLDSRWYRLRMRQARRNGKAAVGDGDEFIDQEEDADDLDDNESDDGDDDEEDAATETRLSDVREVQSYDRVKTHIKPLDDIFGGGMAYGFVYGIAGDAGAGKSSLCLQLARALHLETRYATAEETTKEIAIRAKRLKIPKRNIVVVETNDITQAFPLPEEREDDDQDDDEFAPPAQRDFDVVIIDCIQKMRHPDYPGRPGGNEQIVRVADYISKTTKKIGCVTIALSRVNSEGKVAGPNDVTHDVDCMMWLQVTGVDKDGNVKNDDPGRLLTIPRKNRGAQTPCRLECQMTHEGLVFG